MNPAAASPGFLQGAVVNRSNRWAAQQTFAATVWDTTLPVATCTVDWDVGLHQVWYIQINANTTIRWPMNLRVGGIYILFAKNASTYTLSYGTQTTASGGGAGVWKWVAGGTTPTFTATAGKIDIITCGYDGTDIIAAIQQNA